MRQMGVRGRLFLAFLGISAFSLIAAAAAMYTFVRIGSALDEVTQDRLPAALVAQRLSRQAERVVAVAPAFLSIETLAEQRQVSARIASEAARLEGMLAEVRRIGIGADHLNQIEPTVSRLTDSLTALGAMVVQRIEASERKAELLRRLADTNTATQRLLAPGLKVMDAEFARLSKLVDSTDGGDGQRALAMRRAAQSIALLHGQQRAQFEASLINDTLLRASTASTADLPVMSFPLQRSVSVLEGLAGGMDERLRTRISQRIDEFRAFIDGPDSIPAARAHELEIMSGARVMMTGIEDISRNLTDTVDQMVADTNANIDAATRRAQSVRILSTGVLIAVVLLSLVCSILIVWLYVGRSLIARLTALTESMTAIADGNLMAAIPESGNDEIGDMTRALTVFRDTAVEVSQTNLREINAARRRLNDAIESISEGFSLYDSDDRLVVCNSVYRKLLYPGIEDVVTPGSTFASIIRQAAERGLVADAEGRIEEWLSERLARHVGADGSHVQRRSDGRWILINERKTVDGGTVAVYADITELKRREQELSDKSAALETKSQALEHLSNQLAKYLSPQVYDSIFTGKQQVKVASNRKKLTIFFSDIAGFTEAADKLESEELTQMLNHYLTEMSRIALEHGATIDKYVGDAILIFFGDPETKGTREDAVACAMMAIAMQKRLADLTDHWRESGIENPLQVRMGIHTGFCTVGNFGSEDRLDYTIIGGAVNTASRLQSLAAPGEILISYETFALINSAIRCESRGEAIVKGMAHPVATYRVVDTFENIGAERRRFREEHSKVSLDINLEAMTNEDREAAAGMLRRALAIVTDQNLTADQAVARKN